MNPGFYVCGFLFSSDMKEVCLIEKRRPVEQVGKLNGVGGRTSVRESMADAMAREFKEEAGVEIHDWQEFASLEVQRGRWHVAFYKAIGDLEKTRSMTDEIIMSVPVKDVLLDSEIHRRCVRNVPSLVQIALAGMAHLTILEHS